MFVTPTLKALDLSEADAAVADGHIYVDPRPVPAYLDVHVPGSVSLQYEFGPGMPSRARDCIPLEAGLILLDDGISNPTDVAAGLRGKGFTVAGYVDKGLSAWGERHGAPASTETLTGLKPPSSALLSVGDPGSPLFEEAIFIPLEQLWRRVDELPTEHLTLIASRGVRAAMAIGMLERSGRSDLAFWWYGEGR